MNEKRNIKQKINLFIGSIGAFIGVVVFGWTKEPKPDYILIIPNLVGVVLGFLTFITSL